MAPRKARLATPAYLERVALWYLERYSGSAARVRQALAKRVRRAVDELEQDREEAEAAAEAVVAKLLTMGYLDDARLARSRVEALRRKGASRRKIVATLRRQGLEIVDIEAALEGREASEELEAARRYVQRRRLGAHHRAGVDPAELRQKDLAKLARAGFSYGVARDALDESFQDT